MYKLFARLLHHRISHTFDSRIRNRQYGFLKGKSTSDPIHIIRRLQELFEATDLPLYMLLTDWKMAFDKLTIVGLTSALRRLGLPSHYLTIIKSIYAQHSFQVRENGFCSSFFPATTGVRQGCPLSPYLFIAFMTVMMHDVDQDIKSHYSSTDSIPHTHSALDPLYDLEYADDLILLSRSRPFIQFVLTSLEKHSTLQLNTQRP